MGAASFKANPTSSAANAQDKVVLQLKWVADAQFAGYYVAKDKGFYKEAGLDVTIKPGGPDVAPPQVIAGGERTYGGGRLAGGHAAVLTGSSVGRRAC